MNGRNLPPGVNVSDIPGNRPEDYAYEEMLDNFYDKLTLTNKEILEVTPNVESLIEEAISYGISVGKQQQATDEAEASFYKTSHELEKIDSLCDKFKKDLLELLEGGN